MKKLLLCTTLTVFMGSAFFSISIGEFQLYPFRILLLLMTAIFLLRGLMPRYKDVILSPRKKNAYSLVFFFSWLCWAGLSALWAQDFEAWIKAMAYLSTAFLMVFLFNTYTASEKDFLPLLKAILFMSALHNTIGWYEVLTQNYLFSPNAAIFHTYDMRVPVSIYGENEYAGLMFFSFFLTYAVYKKSVHRRGAFLYPLLMLSNAGLLLIGTSRAYQLAFLLGLAYLFFSMRRGKLALMLCGVSLILVLPGVLDHLLSNLKFNFTPSDTGSTGIRVNLIRNGLYFFMKTHGMGTGAGQIESWMKYKAIYPTGGIINIHNWWGELLTGYGIIVFLGYLIFYIKLFLDLRQKQKKHGDVFSQAFCCCLIGFVVGSVSSSSNMSAEWIWIIFALMIAYQGKEPVIHDTSEEKVSFGK